MEENQNLNPDNTGREGGMGENKPTQKTFTQEDVNRLLKTEKESAKKSLLKELGVEDAKTAKEGLVKYKEILDKDKSAAEMANENLANETRAKLEAEERARMAEAKVEILTTGGKPEYLDDLITLALQKVSEDKDLSTVVKEMKEDSKYQVFFVDSNNPSEDRGTGGGAGYKKNPGSNQKGSLGTRLGSQSWGDHGKNPYFNN